MSLRLKVATFNVRCGVADDGPDSWPHRRELCVHAVEALDADAVCLQEAFDYQIQAITDALPRYGCIAVGREDGVSEGEHCAILYDKARLRLLSSETFWFSDTPSVPGSCSWGNIVTRICTWVEFAGPDGALFRIYNLHLDHESQNAREKSTEMLLAHLQQDIVPSIVTGDFNCEEGNPALQRLIDAGYADSYRRVRPDDTEVCTYHAFQGHTFGDKIDYILTRPEIGVEEAQIVRWDESGRYPSDHYPVTATLVLPE